MNPTVSDSRKSPELPGDIRRTEESSVANSISASNTLFGLPFSVPEISEPEALIPLKKLFSAPSAAVPRSFASAPYRSRSAFMIVDLPALVYPIREARGSRDFRRRLLLVFRSSATSFSSLRSSASLVSMDRRSSSSWVSPSPRLDMAPEAPPFRPRVSHMPTRRVRI